MNDTVVGAMRWCCCLVLAACSSGPSLGVSVHHPDGYGVVQTVVTVYAGGGVVCAAIELGDYTAAELAAVQVDEVDAASGASIEVSRLGPKSIVARGYDGQHRFVTAGCEDLGDLSGDTRLEIDTQPTATVAIDPGQPDRPFSERTILVNMTDANGAVLDGELSWQLTGPSGAATQTATAGTTTQNGNLRFQVADLGMPGPEGLRIRAPWATQPLPLVTAFDLSHATSVNLGGGSATSHPSCDVRGHAGGSPTLVCLTQANASGHRDAIEIAWQTDHYAATQITIPTGIDNQFALFVDHDGSAGEPVYVVSGTAAGSGSWYKLGDASSSSVVFGAGLQNVVYIPRCADNSKSAFVGVETGTALGIASQIQFFTPAGTAVGNGPSAGEVFSGGCVDDVDQKEHQGVVLAGASGDAALALLGGTGATITAIASPKLTGSGFVTVTSRGVTEKRFAGTRLQASGTVVFEAVLAPQGNNYTLVERTELDAAAPPERIIGGRLDRDADTDLMWDMGIGARRRAFQVSLAEQVAGAPLTALTSGPTAISASLAASAEFTAADLNGKGSDEMILYTQSAVTIYATDE